MNQLKLVILCITSLLLLIPIAGAAYDVVSNISSNSTEYTTAAYYGELHNLSLATGAGTTFLSASWDARMNFTAPLYGRFLKDGVSLGRFNLTQNVYATVGSYQVAFEETAGTHNYGWEVYSNKKGTIYSRNFSAVFLKSASYAYGGFDVLFSNGTNVLAAGTKAHVKAKYAGTLTDLTARSVETGSINISAYNLTLGTYIGSVVITAGTDGSTSGLTYAFAKGDWLNLTVTSVTDIKQVTAAVQTVRS